jgi:hypothetical protein
MNTFRFELGQRVYTAVGQTKVLGRTNFLVPESYLVEIDGQQYWLEANDISPTPIN